MSETGWGEFEVQVKIHFHDAAAEKPVTIYHVLKLFHAQSGESQSTSSALVQGRKMVVSEFYDEIVFQVSALTTKPQFVFLPNLILSFYCRIQHNTCIHC